MFHDVIDLFTSVLASQHTPVPRLTWDNVKQQIRETAKRIPLSIPLQILLSTDGSVTNILEILTSTEVSISTKMQEVTTCSELTSPPLAREMTLDYYELVNLREVWLQNDSQKLAFAISVTPFSRLEPDFTRDLTKADLPIGKLLAKYNIESRREIVSIGTYYANQELAEAFCLPERNYIPFRNYNIVKGGQILMKILEFFNPSL